MVGLRYQNQTTSNFIRGIRSLTPLIRTSKSMIRGRILHAIDCHHTERARGARGVGILSRPSIPSPLFFPISPRRDRKRTAAFRAEIYFLTVRKSSFFSRRSNHTHPSSPCRLSVLCCLDQPSSVVLPRKFISLHSGFPLSALSTWRPNFCPLFSHAWIQ